MLTTQHVIFIFTDSGLYKKYICRVYWNGSNFTVNQAIYFSIRASVLFTDLQNGSYQIKMAAFTAHHSSLVLSPIWILTLLLSPAFAFPIATLRNFCLQNFVRIRTRTLTSQKKHAFMLMKYCTKRKKSAYRSVCIHFLALSTYSLLGALCTCTQAVYRSLPTWTQLLE